MNIQTLKSEASANEILSHQMFSFEYERKQWERVLGQAKGEKVLKAPVKREVKTVAKQGFFARLFKAA